LVDKILAKKEKGREVIMSREKIAEIARST
jgi:hypothetical protein